MADPIIEEKGQRWTSAEHTERAGCELAPCLQPGDSIALVGDLGAGKTLLVRGIAAGLAIPPEVRVTSPTFTLVNEYHGGRLPLYHADLYRIDAERELDELGLDELCRRGDGVVCVEWHDRFPMLGRDYLEVTIEVIGDEEREVSVRGTGARSQELAAAWTERLTALAAGLSRVGDSPGSDDARDGRGQ